MPFAVLLPVCAPVKGVEESASVMEALDWALSGLEDLIDVDGEATLVVLRSGGSSGRETLGRRMLPDPAVRLIGVALDESPEGRTLEELSERAFVASVSVLSALDRSETVIFLIPWGRLDPVTSSALLGALAHSLTAGRRLTVVARRPGGSTSGRLESPPKSVLEAARIAEILSRILEKPQRTSLWVELMEAAAHLRPGPSADLLKEAALLSLGVSLGSPLMVHLHLCRVLELLEGAETEAGKYYRQSQPVEVVPLLVGEFARRASRTLGLGSGYRLGALPSELIGRLLSLYKQSGMALQYHLLLSEVAGTLDEAPSAGRGGDPSTLASFLLERIAVECRIGRLPPGTPLFRLWFLAGGSLDFLRPGALGQNGEKELGAWLERLMAARHNSKPVKLLEQAMSARYTSDHVRNFLAHSGFVHYVVRDVVPLEDGGYVVYYDEAALEGIEGMMTAGLLRGDRERSAASSAELMASGP